MARARARVVLALTWTIFVLRAAVTAIVVATFNNAQCCSNVTLLCPWQGGYGGGRGFEVGVAAIQSQLMRAHINSQRQSFA